LNQQKKQLLHKKRPKAFGV